MPTTPKGHAHIGWAPEHLTDPRVKVINVNEDSLLHEQGHESNAMKLDWHTEQQRLHVHDSVDAEGFAELMTSIGDLER